MSLSVLPDEQLYDLFRQNDNPQVFKELMHRYEPYVVAKCYQRLKDHDDAQDVAQEVVIRLLTKAHTYRSSAAFKPWLATIIYNRCTDHLQEDKHSLHLEISGKIADTLVEDLDSPPNFLPTIEILQELMEKISSQDKMILLLKYEQCWSIKAIEDLLNLTESTVKQRLKRSREKLRILLKIHSASSRE